MTKRIGELDADPAPDVSAIFEVERAGGSFRWSVDQMQEILGAALALVGGTASDPATPTTNNTSAVANMKALQTVLAALGFDAFTTAQPGTNPNLELPTSILSVVSTNPGTYPAGFSGGGNVITGRRNITPYRGVQLLIGEATGRIWVRTNFSTWGAWTEVTRGGADATITSMTAITAITSALTLALPNRVAQYTLATLPSAATYNAHEIDVTNATGGPKRCRSNGTVWQILNTTTTVS